MRRMITDKQQQALRFVQTEDKNGGLTLTEIRFDKPISSSSSNTYIKYIDDTKNLQIGARGKVIMTGDAGLDLGQQIFVNFSTDPEVNIFGGYDSEIDDSAILASFNNDGFTVKAWDESEEDFTGRLRVDKNGHVIMTLPTSDPHVAGALWNDNGALKISAGQ